MGINNSKRKIVFLDENPNNKLYADLNKNQNYKPIFYNNFDEFIEKQKLDQIHNIVVRYDAPINNTQSNEQPNYHEEHDNHDQSKISLENNIPEASSVLNNKQPNPFQSVCQLFITEVKSLKNQLIQYIKKYVIELNIYLFVEDTTNIRLLQHEKPYIKLVSSNIDYIISTIQNSPLQNNGMVIKMQRMFHGLYRRIMVKIIDKAYNQDPSLLSSQLTKNDIKILKQSDISYQYFNDVKNFQKSNISTTCQYVLCYDDVLGQIIDSKKLCQEDYNIIVRKNMNDLIQYANQRKIKSIWAASEDLSLIIDKMKNCSENSVQQTPTLSKNTIIIGNDKQYLQNMNEIQKQFRNRFKKQLTSNNMNVSFLKGSNQSIFLQQLKKDIYSFVVVFTGDEFLQSIKRFLQLNNFHHRVQLTNIPKQKTNYKDKIRYLCNQIKYNIKFQITPLYNIQLYKPTQLQINFFNRKLGIKVDTINNLYQIVSQNLPIKYQRIIESQYLVCKIDQYQTQIKSKLKYYKDNNDYFKKIKIILIDSKKKIKKFVSHHQNYQKDIVFVGCNLRNVEEFIKYCKTSAVSIPFFRKNVLSNFDDISKMFSVARKSCELSFKSSVICSNEVLSVYLSKNIKFSTLYNLQFMIFSNFQRGVQNYITFFQEEYIPTYTKLWFLGYNILQKKANQYLHLEALKQDICLCFYKCKSYDLLKVTQQDFQTFYIKKIQSCKTFFDLQISCIYILSLPHNFNEIINHLFKTPRKSKLSIKIFSSYIIVLLTTFCQFGTEQTRSKKLIVLIQQDNIKDKIEFLQPRDIVFSNNFIFCSDMEGNMQKQNKNAIIFSFENVQFLQKSRIKNFLQISKYSFYKQGAEYIIPPFTKFQVAQIRKNQFGKHEIILQNIKNNRNNNQQTFTEKVLLQNEITQQILWQTLKKQMSNLQQDNEQNNKQIYLSLYRQIQNVNLTQSKYQSIKQFSKGIYYDSFFQQKNNNKYLSALIYLQNKIQEIYNQQNQKRIQHSKLITQLKMLNNQYSYIYFKMSQYASSLNYLKQLKNYLIQFVGNQCQSNQDNQMNWKLKIIQKFINSVESTYENRKKLIIGYPKKKLWKVQFKEGRIRGKMPQFVLKSRSEQWTVTYDKNLQIFPLMYDKKSQNNNKMEKILNNTTFLPLTPQNQFGVIALNLINSNLYCHPHNIYNLTKINSKKQNSIIQNTEKGNNQQINNYRMSQKLPTIQWQVFYFGNQIKVVEKHKHFHAKYNKSSKINQQEIEYCREEKKRYNNYLL